jgi:hypothetical protein
MMQDDNYPSGPITYRQALEFSHELCLRLVTAVVMRLARSAVPHSERERLAYDAISHLWMRNGHETFSTFAELAKYAATTARRMFSREQRGTNCHHDLDESVSDSVTEPLSELLTADLKTRLRNRAAQIRGVTNRNRWNALLNDVDPDGRLAEIGFQPWPEVESLEGVNPTTLRSHVMRARTELKEALQRWNLPEDEDTVIRKVIEPKKKGGVES